MPSRPPRIGLNLFAHESFRAAAGPLFADGLVDALEWDVDESWGYGGVERARRLPSWIAELLDLYSDDDALYGHGVWFSLLSARWEERQARWLEALHVACGMRRYRHLSEHFGFHTARGFRRGTMFPAPYTDGAVRVGRDRLRLIKDAAGGVHVGVENAAVALGAADAEAQGDFIADVLGGDDDAFLVLDVHNVWTQSCNLGLSPDALLRSFPLARVRELHIAGGSWYTPRGSDTPFRLDSHDGPVPAEAFALLPTALRECPNVEVVFLEHRGANLETADDVAQLQADFRRVRQIVEAAS